MTIQGDAVTRNSAYYIIAHAAKYVRPGSIRIASEEVAGLPNVAFETPTGSIVVIVLNDSHAITTFNLNAGGTTWRSSLYPGAVATYVLPPSSP